MASSSSRHAGWCPGAMTTAVETAAASKINCKVSRSPAWVESEIWPKAIINAIHTHLISWQSPKDPQKFKRCDWLPTVSCANDSVLFGWISLDFWNMQAMLWGLVGLENNYCYRCHVNTRLLPQRVRTQGAIWNVSPSGMVIWLRATDMD